MIEVGDRLPFQAVRLAGQGKVELSYQAGRHLLLCWLGSASLPGVPELARALSALPVFDGEACRLLLLSVDPKDERDARLLPDPPRVDVLWDFERKLTMALGLLTTTPGQPRPAVRACSVLLDPALRVERILDLDEPLTHGARVEAAMREALAAWPRTSQPAVPIPVLPIPRVLDAALCAELIAYFDAQPSRPSGVTATRFDGTQEYIVRPEYKVRRDVVIEDEGLQRALRRCLDRRVVPEIQRAFQFKVTRMERYVIGAYLAEEGGWFNAHRDNTGPLTAHRRFACSLNLNEDYEGGDIRFPEYGPHAFRPAKGGAIAFSCHLLHRVEPVRAGRRLAVLPFLYDEEGEALRRRNAAEAERRR